MTARAGAAVVVVVAAGLPYLSALGNYFVGDDFGLVPWLAAQPLARFPRFFVESWAPAVYGAPLDELRPFPALTYQIGSAIGGEASGHHAISLLLHTINALLVMTLAATAGHVSRAAAVLAGTAFAVMPLHTEAVAWITARAEIVYTPFALLTLLAWAAWRQSGRLIFHVAALVCLFAALFSKQNAMILPAVLVGYDLLVARLPLRALRAGGWRWYLPVAGVTLLYVTTAYLVFSTVVRSSQVTLETMATFALYQAMYVVMLLSGETVIVRDAFLAPIASASLVAAAGALVLAALLRAAGAGTSRPTAGPARHLLCSRCGTEWREWCTSARSGGH